MKKDVGVCTVRAYPAAGLSHCLVQDKQPELAHVVIYYTEKHIFYKDV